MHIVTHNASHEHSHDPSHNASHTGTTCSKRYSTHGYNALEHDASHKSYHKYKVSQKASYQVYHKDFRDYFSVAIFSCSFYYHTAGIVCSIYNAGTCITGSTQEFSISRR